MAIKTIAVSMVDLDRQEEIMRGAFLLAEQHNAHVMGVYAVPGFDMIAIPAAQVAVAAQTGYKRYFEDNAASAREKFEEAARKHGVRSEWREATSDTPLLADAVLKHAPFADLIVTGQVNSSTSEYIETDFAERLLLESGRPVLVIPNIGTYSKIGTKVLVGWNATKEAMRATFDALPLLERAKQVELLWANARDEAEFAGDLPGAEMAAALARHDVNVVTRSISSSDMKASDALLNEAADTGADLLVIGAYGHSRLREFVFGGVTRSLLASMTLPVLMSH